MANDRVTQEVVEAALLPDAQKGRVTEVVAEVAVLPDRNARVSQVIVEAAYPIPHIILGRIDQPATAFAPSTVAPQAIVLDLIDQTAATLSPAITVGSVSIDLGLIDQAAVAYAPGVGGSEIFPSFINQTATAHAPTLEAAAFIAVGLIDQTAGTFTPVVSPQQFVDLGLIDQAAVVFSPVVSAPSPQSVDVDLIDQTATTFSPTINPGPVSISAGFISNTASASRPFVNSSAYGSLVYSDGPIAYWRLGESSGTTAVSVTGSHNGTYQNTPTLGVTGALTNDANTAITLNGTNELVRVTDSVSFDYTTGPISIEAWIKHTGTFSGSGDAIVGKGSSQPYFQLDTDGALEFQKADEGVILRGGSVSSNTWHHVVVTYHNGVAGEIYLDGTAVGGSVTDRTFVANSTDLGIGSKYGFPATDLFHGSLDEVAIYNYVLTAEQVNSHYLAGIDADVALGFIDQTAVAFAPTVDPQTIFASFINQTATIAAPSVSRNISLGLIDQTAVAYAPEVNHDLQAIDVARIDQTAVAYTPSFEWDKFVFFDRIDRQALPFNPSLSGGVTIPVNTKPATVVIRYNGTNITDDVMIVGASFTSQANGTPGTCSFRIKDPDHSRSITTGKRLTLDINGERAWTGYVSRVSRVYPFPAQNTSNPSSVTRLLQVDGVDINILFKKRFVFEKANPKRLFGRKYSANNTDDTVAFADLVEDFLDLGGDNLDTSTLIENVGTINVDHPANPIGVGHDWASSMRSITALSNAVYYIDPDRKVVLTDVDTPNAPFDLSDDPADSAVGYQNMELLYNGSSMINDMIVWGAGAGSGQMVYSREEDATSISAHGRWQAGEFRGDMYKQGTVDRRADSIVQGSAQSKRGAKDDQITVICTVFEPGLRVAQKVDFTSAAFGYQDVLPIRRQTITFVSPAKPKYQIVAGHEIDMPWGFFDVYRYDFDFDFGLGGDLPDLPGIDIDIPDPDGDCQCSDEICGITDTFSRTVTDGSWGVSDSGASWATFDTPLTVDGSRGVIDLPAGDFSQTLLLFGAVETYDALWLLQTDRSLDPPFAHSGAGQPLGDVVRVAVPGTTGGTSWVFFELADGEWWMTDSIGNTSDGSVSIDTASPFYVRAIATSTDIDIYVWPANGTEPGSPTGTLARPSGMVLFGAQVGAGNFDTPLTLYVEELDVAGISSCSEHRFDNFNRTIANGSGFGTTDSGRAWENSVTSGLGVDGTSAKLTGPLNTSMIKTVNITSPIGGSEPWNDPAGFTMTCRFKLSIIHTVAFNYNQLGWFFYSDGQAGTIRDHHSCGFQITNNASPGGVIYMDNSSVGTKLDWVANAWYMVKYQLVPGDTARMKFWLESDGEPGTWFAEQSDIGEPPLTGVETIFYMDLVNTKGGTPSQTIANNIFIDYIDFDYEGGPCNGHRETQEVLDDFNRSIAVANGSGLTAQWGDTSGTGDPWTNVYDNSLQGHLEYGVDNGEAIARFVMDQPFTQTKTMMMTLNEGGSDLFPFNTVGDGVPDQLFETDDVTWAIDFLTTTVAPTRLPYLEIDWADRIDRDVDGALIGISMFDQVSPVSPEIQVDGFTNNGVPHPFNPGTGYFQADTWYTVEVGRQGDYVFIRVYQADSAPPGWQVSLQIDPTLWEAGEFTIWGSMREINGSPTTEEFRFRNFRLLDTPCDPTTVTLPGSGRVCEDFTGDGSTTDFFTTQTQKYGVTSVSVDGVYKTLHEYDQIESGGNLVGVSMIAPPANGAVVHVCYTVGEGIGPFSLGPV